MLKPSSQPVYGDVNIHDPQTQIPDGIEPLIDVWMRTPVITVGKDGEYMSSTPTKAATSPSPNPSPTFSTQPRNRLFSAFRRPGRRVVVRGTPSKSAVVKTYPLHKPGFGGIMPGHHVFEMHAAQEGWQGTSLLVHCGKSAVCGRQSRAAGGALPGLNQ